MDLKSLFFCPEVFERNYASVEHLFGYQLKTKQIYHTWIISSEKVQDVQQFQKNYATGWTFPKRRSGSITELFRTYLLNYKDLKKIVRTVSNIPHDFVVVRDDPMMAYFAWAMSQKWGIPFIYQLSHLKEEEILLTRLKSERLSWVSKTLKGYTGLFFRNRLLKKADVVLAISNEMKKTLSRKYQLTNIIVLPEGIEKRDEPNEELKKELINSLDINDHKVLIYVGTLNAFRQLNFLLTVFHHTQKAYSGKLKLLIVGDGPQGNEITKLQSQCESLGILNDVIFTGRIQRNRVSHYISISDIGVSPFPPNEVYINNFPIKVLEYLQMGLPVVASNIPEQQRIIQESGGGYCVAYNIHEFSQAILELLNDSERASQMGKKGKNYIIRYDFELLSSILLSVYLTLHKKRAESCND